MTQKNKYGLPRDIPEGVKREVRKNCGFGCVICGLGIYQYEHIDPEFKDAKKHDPVGIVLLCVGCHDKKTRGFLSSKTVKKAMKTPKALQAGFSKEVFDIGDGSPTIVVGNLTFKNCYNLVMIENEVLLRTLPPEEEGGPFRLSGYFTDSYGNTTLIIRDNEWFTTTNNWDVEAIGGRLIIKEKNWKPHLVLSSHPPDKISIDFLHMKYQGITLKANKDGFAGYRGNTMIAKISNGTFIDFHFGVHFTKNSFSLF